MNISQAPTPVTLKSGQIVILSPLTTRDFMSLFQAAKMRELQIYLGAIPPETDAVLRREMIASAYEQSRNFDVESDAFWQNPANIVEALFLSLHKETKGMTREKVAELIEDNDDWNLLVTALMSDAPAGNEIPTEDETQKKTE